MADRRAFGRVVETLERKLRETSDISLQRLYRIQLAGVTARQGRPDEARRLVAELREENHRYEPRLSAWIMYTEGLIKHFESLDVLASRDRLRRAYAVSVAMGDDELRAISAAWLADSDFRLSNIESAIAHLAQVFECSQPSEHEARGRGCLVLADLMSWAGMHDDARQWYRKSRDHSIALGDIGMQSVVLFNSVSFRVAALVVQDCFHDSSSDAALRLQRETLSVSNLDAGLGIRTLTTMVPALQADLDTVLKNWGLAISLFDGFIGNIHADGQGRLAAKFLAQRAWCLSNIGRNKDAETDVERTLEVVGNCPDLDDLAVVYSRLSATYLKLGNASQSVSCSAVAQRCITEYIESQRRLRSRIGDVITIAMK